MKVSLVNYTPNPEEAIIRAAANCWQSAPHEGILDHIIKAGHWTPLEFATFNFEISGVSRALTHQLVRKRVGVAFAQESQRYVELEEIEYVTPPSFKEGEHQDAFLYAYNHIMFQAQELYKFLTFFGVPQEDARYVLPSACTSSIHMSVNYHALLDLSKERLCKKAQWEIRQLVKELKKEVTAVSSKLASYMQPKCYWLGRCPEKKSCGEGFRYECTRGNR